MSLPRHFIMDFYKFSVCMKEGKLNKWKHTAGFWQLESLPRILLLSYYDSK